MDGNTAYAHPCSLTGGFSYNAAPTPVERHPQVRNIR